MERKEYKNLDCDRLFVYGTLQHGQSRNYILSGLKYEQATLFNYRKVIPPTLGFPFIIRNESSSVRGEVYFGLEPFLINQIDMIEGEGQLYHRILVNVKLVSGNETEVFTYYPSEVIIKNYKSFIGG